MDTWKCVKYSRSSKFSNVATMDARKQVQWSLGLALYAGRWDNPVISAHALCCFQRDVIIACVCMALHVAEISHLELFHLLLNTTWRWR